MVVRRVRRQVGIGCWVVCVGVVRVVVRVVNGVGGWEGLQFVW